MFNTRLTPAFYRYDSPPPSHRIRGTGPADHELDSGLSAIAIEANQVFDQVRPVKAAQVFGHSVTKL